MPDALTKRERSALMSRIRSKWTRQEVEFKMENPQAERGEWLPHRPDFTLGGKAVYLDSDFWHGRVPERTFSKMKTFWREKLFRNILRDASRDAFWSSQTVLEAVSGEGT